MLRDLFTRKFTLGAHSSSGKQEFFAFYFKEDKDKDERNHVHEQELLQNISQIKISSTSSSLSSLNKWLECFHQAR